MTGQRASNRGARVSRARGAWRRNTPVAHRRTQAQRARPGVEYRRVGQRALGPRGGEAGGAQARGRRFTMFRMIAAVSPAHVSSPCGAQRLGPRTGWLWKGKVPGGFRTTSTQPQGETHQPLALRREGEQRMPKCRGPTPRAAAVPLSMPMAPPAPAPVPVSALTTALRWLPLGPSSWQERKVAPPPAPGIRRTRGLPTPAQAPPVAQCSGGDQRKGRLRPLGPAPALQAEARVQARDLPHSRLRMAQVTTGVGVGSGQRWH